MEQNMTALVSLFARAYHQKNKDIKIFNDPLSTKLITEKEYEMKIGRASCRERV